MDPGAEEYLKENKDRLHDSQERRLLSDEYRKMMRDPSANNGLGAHNLILDLEHKCIIDVTDSLNPSVYIIAYKPEDTAKKSPSLAWLIDRHQFIGIERAEALEDPTSGPNEEMLKVKFPSGKTEFCTTSITQYNKFYSKSFDKYSAQASNDFQNLLNISQGYDRLSAARKEKLKTEFSKISTPELCGELSYFFSKNSVLFEFGNTSGAEDISTKQLYIFKRALEQNKLSISDLKDLAANFKTQGLGGLEKAGINISEKLAGYKRLEDASLRYQMHYVYAEVANDKAVVEDLSKYYARQICNENAASDSIWGPPGALLAQKELTRGLINSDSRESNGRKAWDYTAGTVFNIISSIPFIGPAKKLLGLAKLGAVADVLTEVGEAASKIPGFAKTFAVVSKTGELMEAHPIYSLAGVTGLYFESYSSLPYCQRYFSHQYCPDNKVTEATLLETASTLIKTKELTEETKAKNEGRKLTIDDYNKINEDSLREAYAQAGKPAIDRTGKDISARDFVLEQMHMVPSEKLIQQSAICMKAEYEIRGKYGISKDEMLGPVQFDEFLASTAKFYNAYMAKGYKIEMDNAGGAAIHSINEIFAAQPAKTEDKTKQASASMQALLEKSNMLNSDKEISGLNLPKIAAPQNGINGVSYGC